MQAIILAAGMGKRLGELTKDNTKCMVKVNGMTLINRLLNQLEKYNEENLKSHIESLSIKTPIIYVSNVDYDKTNNIYSLYLANKYLVEQDTILFESDLIFEDKALEKIINSPIPNVVLVAKYQSWM